MFDDLTVFKAALVEHGDLKRLAVGRPYEPAAIRPARRHPHPDLVVAGDHLFDGQVEIREGRPRNWSRRPAAPRPRSG